VVKDAIYFIASYCLTMSAAHIGFRILTLAT